MVERSNRRRGMYDITKTRILLTTAVFAAVAAVFAGGANARALAEDGSGIGAEPAAQAAQGAGRSPSATSARPSISNNSAGYSSTSPRSRPQPRARSRNAHTPVPRSRSRGLWPPPRLLRASLSGLSSAARMWFRATSTTTGRVRARSGSRGPGPTSSPTAVAAVPRRQATSRAEDGAAAAPSSRR